MYKNMWIGGRKKKLQGGSLGHLCKRGGRLLVVGRPTSGRQPLVARLLATNGWRPTASPQQSGNLQSLTAGRMAKAN
jgi:hypothetical protein